MFTGIIQSIGTVKAFRRTSSGARLEVETALPPEILRLGDSIAVDGCCQTIAALDGATCAFDVLNETLARTIFGDYRAGRQVNIEPALCLGERLGGHLVQGHVDTTSMVQAVRKRAGDRAITLQRPPRGEFPLVEKGSVTINGVSLTVAELAESSFTVCVIPHTWNHTAFQDLRAGSRVNLESDVIGRYVASLLAPYSSGAQVTMEQLLQAGF